jgi:hypothetical protein
MTTSQLCECACGNCTCEYTKCEECEKAKLNSECGCKCEECDGGAHCFNSKCGNKE